MTTRRFIRPRVVLAVLAIALAALVLASARSALGQEPTPTATAEPTVTPTPLVVAEPSVFFGSVTIRGEPAPDGTPIRARMARQAPEHPICGTTTTSGGRYRISVVGEDIQHWCGRNGDMVSFHSRNLMARQHGQFLSGTAQQLDLTLARPIDAEPAAFFGSVTIDGLPAPDGTPIQALIGDVVCGTTTTTGGRYGTSVNAGFGFGSDFQEGCGGSGPDAWRVVFRSGQLIANETGRFIPMAAQELDLSFGRTPHLPDTGSPRAAHRGSAAPVTRWLWALLGVGTAALIVGLAGRRVAR